MKMITFTKHNVRRIISVIVLIITVVLMLYGTRTKVSADELSDLTERNRLMESILNTGGTLEEAIAAVDKLYCEQHGLPYTQPNGSNDSGMETVPHQTQKEPETHKHNYIPTVSKEATCSETGTMTYSCECGDSYKENIKKTEHKYMPGDVEMGTCSKKRTEHFTCSICGDSYTVEGEYGDHLYFPDTEASRDASCNDFGKKVKVCNICGDIVEEVLPMTGHGDTVETVITEATCTENGKKHLVCSVCGKVMKVEIIPFTGHVMSDTPEVVTEPTLMSKGLEHYKCINCGIVMEEKEIPASISSIIPAPDKEGDGFAIPLIGCVVVVIFIIAVVTAIVRKRKRR